MWLVRTTAGHFTELLLNYANQTEICSASEQSWKKVYLSATIKSIPLLQPEYGFCQKNGSERGQTQDWYMNEKMAVVPTCLNGRCCSSECMGIVLY